MAVLKLYNKLNRLATMAQLDHKHDNPLNSSSSKHQYSFSKTNRFNFHAKTEVPDHFYEVPSTRQQLSFSFGKSLRSDFTKHEKTSQSPPPNSYHFEGDIEKLLKKKEGVRILYGREQCKSGNIFKYCDNPGPGMYNPNPEITTKKLCREMTLGKLPSSKRLVAEPPLPGPGAYPIKSLILNDNKVLSKQTKLSYGKIIFPTIKPERSISESSPQLRLPEVTYKGESSSIPSNKGFSVSRAERFKACLGNLNPGPGSYQKFSQFIQGQSQ